MEIYINNLPVKASSDSTILECCSMIGIDLPRFCYHQELSVVGNCRMCLVEIEKSPKPIAACATPISSNIKIFTNTPLVKKAREGILEFLLINHPLDCPICDQGGECDLQDQVMNFGSDRGRFYEKKRNVEDKNCGLLIKTIMTRCIHCTRCIRFSSEIADIDSLGVVNRGGQTEITTFIDKTISNELSGNLIDICPVGALTSKPYAFNARPWELKSIESIDIFDSLGTNIQIYYKESKIARILPKINQILINQEWITDKIRFSYDGLYNNRLFQPLKFNLFYLTYTNFSWDFFIKNIKILFKNTNSSEICLILGNNLDSETLITSKILAENNGILKIVNDQFFFNDINFSEDYSFSREIIEKADCFFLIGTNLRVEANLLDLQIKKNKYKKTLTSILIGFSHKSNSTLNKFIGLNLQIYFEILEGKHKYSKFFKTSQFPVIIYGSSILNRIDSFQLLKTLKNFNNKIKLINQDTINLLLLNSNSIGNTNLGISSFFPEILNKIKIIYLIHVNQEFLNYLGNYIISKLYNFKNLPIIIYQSSHFITNEILEKNNTFIRFFKNNSISYFIPGKTFIEKEGTFFNIENKSQKTFKICKSIDNIQSREDSQILQIINERILKNINKHLLEIIPAKKKINKTFMINNINVFNHLKFYKTLLKPIIENFYMTNIILQNSLTMGDCSNNLKKNFQNFQLMN